MSLPGQQLSLIRDAILAAYTPESLAQMVRVQLAERLYDVAGGEDFRAVVFHLVEWADRNGRLPELVRAAHSENPGNPALAAVATAFEPVRAEGVQGQAQAEVLPARDRLPRIWNLQHRNANFVGRSDELERLCRALSAREPGSNVQVITGLGGIGKTQTAIEYVYQRAGDYDVAWWVRAEEPAVLAGDYAALAAALNLPGAAGIDQSAAVQAVLRWFESHNRWLLVLDNAIEPPAVRDYLPRGTTGHVLITTRHAAGWKRLGAAHALPVLALDEAVDFLLRRSGDDDAEGLADVAQELGCLPLALEQAGAYMEQSGKNAADYLRLYRTRRRILLGRDGPTGDYPDTVATTWTLAFGAVSKIPGAGELLNLCAYLAPNAIPLALIGSAGELLPPKLAAAMTDEVGRDDAVAALRHYSLAQIEDGTLNVHSLVQAVARDRLSAKGQKTWAGTAVRLIDATFGYESDDLSTWENCEALVSHALVAAEHAGALDSEPEAAGRLLNQVGRYLRLRARFGDARHAHERSLAIAEAVYGANHPTVAIRVNNLGSVLYDLGDLPKARQAFERALAIDVAVYGANHPVVAIRINNLGLVLKDLGDLPGARQAFEQALAVDEAVYGANHPAVAIRVNNLGSVLQDLGDPPGARQAFEQALAIDEAVYGENHPAVARDVNNLGSVLKNLGDLPGARKAFERSLAIAEAVYGANHPTVATCVNNLGLVLKDLGDLPGARKAFEQALAIDEAVYGPNHPTVAVRINNLGSVLQELGDLPGARQAFERALAIFSNYLGGDHPYTKKVRNNIEALDT